MNKDTFKELDSAYKDLWEAGSQLLEGLDAREASLVKDGVAHIKVRLEEIQDLVNKKLPKQYRHLTSSGRTLLPQERLREDLRDLVGAIEGGDATGVIVGVDRLRAGLKQFGVITKFGVIAQKAAEDEEEIHLKVIVVMDCRVKKSFGIEGLMENAPTYIDYAVGKDLKGTASPYRLEGASLYVDINDFEMERAEGIGPFAPSEKDKWMVAPQTVSSDVREVS
jgi:hypothetical protein